MEIEFKDVSFGIRKVYEDQFAVETRVDASERGGVSKTLSVEAEAKVSGVELLSGEARISGKVNYRLLYLDRQEKLCGLDYFKDFEFAIKGEEIRADERQTVDLSVIEATGVADGNGIELSAVVGALLTTYGEREERAVAAVRGAEIKEEIFKTQRFRAKKDFSIELEKEESAGANIKKIVLFDAAAAIREASAENGFLRVTGDAEANVVYVTEEGETVERAFSFPFSREEEMDAERASFHLSVKNARVVLSGDEENSLIEIEIALTLTVCEFSDREISAVTDVYPLETEAEEKRKVIPLRPFLSEAFFRVPLSGVIEEEGVRRVVTVRPGGSAIATVAACENAVKVEGVASFTAVFEKEEGYFSKEKEFPFSFDLPYVGAKTGDSAEAAFEALSVTSRLTAGGIEVAAETSVKVSLFGNEEISFLSDLTECGPRAEEDAGVTVYFAEKGEDLWSIAKAMRAAPSALVKANPFLAEPLDEAKKIMIFRGK